MNTSHTFVNKSLAALMAAIAVFPVGQALAQGADQRLQALEQRMDRFENKFETLLNLLQQQPNANSFSSLPSAQHSTHAANSSAAPTRLRMGQVYLDVYTLPRTKNGRLPTSTDDVAAGSALVNAGYFGFGAFADAEGTKNLVSYKDAILLSWNGLMKISSAGQHSFVLVADKRSGKYMGNECSSVLFVSNKEVVKLDFEYRNQKNEIKYTSQGKVNLDPGFYDFDLRLICNGNGPNTRETLKMELLVAAPGDRSAKPIPAEMFGIKE